MILKDNELWNVTLLSATWVTTVINSIAKEDITFVLATLVSVASLFFLIVSARKSIIETRKIKKELKNAKNKNKQ